MAYEAPQSYKDLDGNMKNFTYVNHDPKTKITPSMTSKQELETIKTEILSYRKQQIKDLLALPASLCPEPYKERFTLKGEGYDKIEWNGKAVVDEGISNEMFYNLLLLTEKRKDLFTSEKLQQLYK